MKSLKVISVFSKQQKKEDLNDIHLQIIQSVENKNSFSACRNLIYGHISKTKTTKGVPHLTKEDQQKLTLLTGLNWVLKYNESFCLSKEYGRGLSKYISFHVIYSSLMI